VPAGAPCALTGGGWPNGPRGAAWGLKAAMVEGGEMEFDERVRYMAVGVGRKCAG
jgi:hypothetical protein